MIIGSTQGLTVRGLRIVLTTITSNVENLCKPLVMTRDLYSGHSVDFRMSVSFT